MSTKHPLQFSCKLEKPVNNKGGIGDLQHFTIFNPEGSDRLEDRQIWGGNSTMLIQLNNVKYTWATKLYQQMISNFWVPEKNDLTQDVTDYKLLLPEEERAYDGILSYLTFLDSLQTRNLPILQVPVTAPEIAMCLNAQTFQEAIHNQSYQYIIETIIPDSKRNFIYELWKTDDTLRERCQYIGNFYQQYIDNPTDNNYFKSVVANYLLEGLYFYNGFIFFYTLCSQRKMLGTADIIKLINRDELSHVRLFQKLIIEAIAYFSESPRHKQAMIDDIYRMFKHAVEYEAQWANYILGNKILGITPESIDCYTKYLANLRLQAIELDILYPDSKYRRNPYRHLESIADLTNKGESKSNFFESNTTAYNMSSTVNGWEDL